MLNKIIKIIIGNRVIRFIFWPVILVKRKFDYLANIRNHAFDDFFSAIKEGTLVINTKNIAGDFEMDIRSHLCRRILVEGIYEGEVVELVNRYINKNKDAINVGANIGLYSVLLANRISDNNKVLSIEPTNRAFDFLQKNITRNLLNYKIILFHGLCTDTAGNFTINLIEGMEEYSCMGESIHLNHIGRENILNFKVQGETLSNLVKMHNLNPGIIIIDVEGAEMKVLNGSIEVLSKYKPIIISEIDDELLHKQECSSVEVFSLLQNLGYNIQSINGLDLRHPFWEHNCNTKWQNIIILNDWENKNLLYWFLRH